MNEKLTKPNVSLIVPVFNQEKYLHQCIKSILEQSYRDFECVLVDDGSKDSSLEICEEYAEKDNRIKVIHKSNGGLTSARKFGFDLSSAEYVCFLDSDDYLHRDFLKVLLNKIMEMDADVVTCGHYQDADGKIIENTFEFPNLLIEKDNIVKEYLLPVIGKIYASGYLNYPGYVWGRIYRRKCISENCFVSEREVYTEDDIFQMYLSANLNKAVFIPDKLVYYRINETSLTHAYRENMWDMLKERHRRVEDFFCNLRNIEIYDRVAASGFYAVYVTLRNAYEQNDYGKFKYDISCMLKDSFSKKVLKKIDFRKLRPRQKLMIILLSCRMYFALYKLKNALFSN